MALNQFTTVVKYIWAYPNRSVAQQLQHDLDLTTRKGREAANSFRNIAGAFTSLIVARNVGAALKSVITPAVKMESSILRVQSVLGASADEMNRMVTAAKKAAEITTFGPQEAMEAMLHLAQAFGNADMAVKALLPTMQLAQASFGELNLKQATQMVTEMTTAFNVPAELIGPSLEKLVKIARITGNELSVFEGIIGKLGVGALSAQQSFEGTVTTFALARKILPSSERAASQVARMFEELADPQIRQKLQNLLPEVGFTDPTTGELRGIQHIMSDLFNAASKSPEAFTAAAQEMSTASIKPLIASIGKLRTGITLSTGETLKGAEALQFLAKAAQEPSKYLQQLSDTWMQSAEGKTQQLMEAFDGLARSLGNDFLPILKSSIDTLKPFLDIISKTITFMSTGAIGAFTKFGLVAALGTATLLGLRFAVAGLIKIFRAALFTLPGFQGGLDKSAKSAGGLTGALKGLAAAHLGVGVAQKQAASMEAASVSSNAVIAVAAAQKRKRAVEDMFAAGGLMGAGGVLGGGAKGMESAAYKSAKGRGGDFGNVPGSKVGAFNKLDAASDAKQAAIRMGADMVALNAAAKQTPGALAGATAAVGKLAGASRVASFAIKGIGMAFGGILFGFAITMLMENLGKIFDVLSKKIDHATNSIKDFGMEALFLKDKRLKEIFRLNPKDALEAFDKIKSTLKVPGVAGTLFGDEIIDRLRGILDDRKKLAIREIDLKKQYDDLARKALEKTLKMGGETLRMGTEKFSDAVNKLKGTLEAEPVRIDMGSVAKMGDLLSKAAATKVGTGFQGTLMGEKQSARAKGGLAAFQNLQTKLQDIQAGKTDALTGVALQTAIKEYRMAFNVLKSLMPEGDKRLKEFQDRIGNQLINSTSEQNREMVNSLLAAEQRGGGAVPKGYFPGIEAFAPNEKAAQQTYMRMPTEGLGARLPTFDRTLGDIGADEAAKTTEEFMRKLSPQEGLMPLPEIARSLTPKQILESGIDPAEAEKAQMKEIVAAQNETTKAVREGNQLLKNFTVFRGKIEADPAANVAPVGFNKHIARAGAF